MESGGGVEGGDEEGRPASASFLSLCLHTLSALNCGSRRQTQQAFLFLKRPFLFSFSFSTVEAAWPVRKGRHLFDPLRSLAGCPWRGRGRRKRRPGGERRSRDVQRDKLQFEVLAVCVLLLVGGGLGGFKHPSPSLRTGSEGHFALCVPEACPGLTWRRKGNPSWRQRPSGHYPPAQIAGRENPDTAGMS